MGASADDCNGYAAAICSACAISLANGLATKALVGEPVLELGTGSFTQQPSMVTDGATIRLVYPDAFATLAGTHFRAFAECEVNMGTDQIDFARLWFRSSDVTGDRAPALSKRLGTATGVHERLLESMGPGSISMFGIGPDQLTHRDFGKSGQ